MKTKLILVEGIPGSGKTTFAKRIAEFYRAKGRAVSLCLEGDSHPADLSWCALIPAAELEAALAPYPELREEIDRNLRLEGDFAILAYTKVITDNWAFYGDMEKYEVYDGRLPLADFAALHRRRWAAFGESAAGSDAITIFECAFLQNHVNELMHFHCASRQAITGHLAALADTVRRLSPVLLYLTQPDVGETLRRVAAERVSPHERWIDRVIEYVANSPYGRQNGLQGFEGAVRCFEERRRVELEAIAALPLTAHVLENPAYNWESLWNRMVEVLPH